jgi:hypothetical protein
VPNFTVTRTGPRPVLIHYRFGTRPASKQAPYTILTTLDAPGVKYVPLTYRTPARQSGVITQTLTRGEMPPRLLVSVYAANGVRSQVLSLAVPPAK